MNKSDQSHDQPEALTTAPAPAETGREADIKACEAHTGGRYGTVPMNIEDAFMAGVRYGRSAPAPVPAPAQGETHAREQWAMWERNTKACEAEIATLRQTVARLTQELNEARDCGQRVDDKLAAAESELAELRKDRERLDWLLKQNPEVWLHGTTFKPAGEAAQFFFSHRAAIDAAMHRQGEGP